MEDVAPNQTQFVDMDRNKFVAEQLPTEWRAFRQEENPSTTFLKSSHRTA